MKSDPVALTLLFIILAGTVWTFAYGVYDNTRGLSALDDEDEDETR